MPPPLSSGRAAELVQLGWSLLEFRHYVEMLWTDVSGDETVDNLDYLGLIRDRIRNVLSLRTLGPVGECGALAPEIDAVFLRFRETWQGPERRRAQERYPADRETDYELLGRRNIQMCYAAAFDDGAWAGLSFFELNLRRNLSALEILCLDLGMTLAAGAFPVLTGSPPWPRQLVVDDEAIRHQDVLRPRIAEGLAMLNRRLSVGLDVEDEVRALIDATGGFLQLYESLTRRLASINTVAGAEGLDLRIIDATQQLCRAESCVELTEHQHRVIQVFLSSETLIASSEDLRPAWQYQNPEMRVPPGTLTTFLHRLGRVLAQIQVAIERFPGGWRLVAQSSAPHSSGISQVSEG